VPVVKITRSPSLDRATYDAVNERVRIGADHPLGLLMHAAGEADGVFQIVEIWASEDYAERYETERLVPAIREVVGSGHATGDPAAVTIYDTHFLVTP
jgi:hypothetical protein